MNGLALITDMEYIKVGNKGFTPQGVKLLLTRGLSPCAYILIIMIELHMIE